MNDQPAVWLRKGEGRPPEAEWSYMTDGPLVDLCVARETGAVIASDSTGGLYLLNRVGRLSLLTRLPHSFRLLAWSDTGSGGAGVVGEKTVCRITPDLQVTWKAELPDAIVSLAVDPHGHHIGIGLASGLNVVFDIDRKTVARFETLRPLRFLRFVPEMPGLVGAADYGFMCRAGLDSRLEWTEKLFSNVGDLSISPRGERILLAGFGHGVQAYDAEGEGTGSFLLEGTVGLVAQSLIRKSISAATLEGHYYLIDFDGEIKWAAPGPDDLLKLDISPLGDWGVYGFRSGRILKVTYAK